MLSLSHILLRLHKSSLSLSKLSRLLKSQNLQSIRRHVVLYCSSGVSVHSNAININNRLAVVFLGGAGGKIIKSNKHRVRFRFRFRFSQRILHFLKRRSE